MPSPRLGPRRSRRPAGPGVAGVGNGAATARRPAPAYSSAAARAAAERALRGTRRFVLRKDQAGLVERLARTGRLRLRRTEGEDDPPTVALGRRPALAVHAGCPLRARRQALGLARLAPPRRRAGWTSPSPWSCSPGLLILGVGRAARFDDLGVMPWIVRLRYEKEITFVEPQQDLMLGRILAETRVPPTELVESLRPRGDQRQAAALPDPADPPAELGPGLRQADRRAGVRLRRRRDPGRAGPRRWRSRPSWAW